MSCIYQVQFLGENRDDVDFTLVFNGNTFDNSNKSKKNQQNVYYTDTSIHMDDTVEIIKQKVLDEAASRVSLPHITGLKSNDLYLFGYVEETVYAAKLKQMISADNDGRTRNIPFDYASNLLANFGLTANKDAWTSDELLSRIFTKNETQKRLKIAKQIGQHGTFMKIGKKNIAVADPYLEWRQDDQMMLKPVNRNPYMLFETFSEEKVIVDNIVYCAWTKFLSEDAEKGSEDAEKNEEKRKWYFPLAKKADPTVRQIQHMHRSMRIADELYGMQFPADYKNPFAFGIEQFRVTVHPIATVKFPLFTIFKQFVSSENHPLIKYNPRTSSRGFSAMETNEFIMEDDTEKGSIYKLYSAAVTTDNEKIPFLAKENINTFIMQRQKKSLSIYVHKLKYKKNHYYVTCDIHADGSISVSSTYPYEIFTFLIDATDVKEIVELAITPILAEIYPLLKSFYSVAFDSLYASNVTVDAISYALFYDKPIRQQIKTNTNKTNPILAELIQPEPVDETNVKVRATARNKMMYAKISNLKRVGFPIVFEDDKMSITKINSVYYLNVLKIYFEAIFYQLSRGTAAQDFLLFDTAAADVSAVSEDAEKDEDVEKSEDAEKDEDVEKEDDDSDIHSDAWDSDDDSDNDDSNDLMDDLEMFGGGGDTSEGGGGSVGDRNPFVTKMKRIMPDLFKENITKMDLKLNKYSRICQNNEPLILTKLEKEALEKNKKIKNPEKDLLKYGNDAHGDALYFSCPKYYCMKEGQEGPVSEEDIKQGKCGSITDVKQAIFTDIKKRENKHVYLPYGDDALFPGFNSSRLQNGFCSPCCFKKIGKKHMEKKKECQGEQDDKTEETMGKKGEKAKTLEKEKTLEIADSLAQTLQKAADNIYILGADSSVPLPNKRWGYLPMVLQEFLNNVSSVCTQEKNPTIHSSLNYNCMLRYGVENYPNKSFVAVIANMLFYQKASSSILSVPDMCTYLATRIRLDDFLLAQNGNLFAVFHSEKTSHANFKTINANLSVRDVITKYHSVVLSEVNLTNPLIHDFVLRVMQSFENFREYLVDPESHVDYTYLWDILCTPNSSLFKDGMNLCILEMNKDMNQVGLVCPTNHSSNAVAFDTEKPTYFMLMSHDHFFEPIYLHKKEIISKKQIIQNVHKYFNPDSSILFIRDIIRQVIMPTFEQQCVLSNAKMQTITELVHQLQKNNYLLQELVMNFVGQIVGVMASNTKAVKSSFVGFFIPCAASSFYPSTELYSNHFDSTESYPPLIFINELSPQPYDKSVAFYHHLTKSIIPYSNIVQVVDKSNKAIGLFISNYDMFVPFSKPKSSPFSPHFSTEERPDVAEMHQVNLQTQLSNEKDEERVNYMNRITLDTKFYNLFKNTMRDLVLKSDSDAYENLHRQCTDSSSHYTAQLETVKKLLEKIGNPAVQFSKMDDLSAQLISENAMKNTNIILPKEHLLSRGDNKQIYYTKLADELIRFKQISHMFFNKKQFMLFQTLEHAVQPHEILILESQLLYKNREYLKNIKSLLDNVRNPYILKHTYNDAGNQNNRSPESYAALMDAAAEKTSQIDSDDRTDEFIACAAPSQPINSTYILASRCFKDTSQYMEIPYDQHPGCGLGLIVDLVYILFGQTITTKMVKDRLIGLYESLMITPAYKKNIMQILIKEIQNKTEIVFVKSGMKQMSDIILTNTFYPVLFDMWLLLNYFKIPSMFISSLIIPEAHQFANQKMFVCYQQDSLNPQFVYINVPSMHHNRVTFPVYRLIAKNKDNNKNLKAIDLKPADILLPVSSCRIQPPPQITIVEYVKNYVPPNYKYIK